MSSLNLTLASDLPEDIKAAVQKLEHAGRREGEFTIEAAARLDADDQRRHVDALYRAGLSEFIGSVPDRFSVRSAEQWRSWIGANASRSGIRLEEIFWSGIEEYLDSLGDQRISKRQLLAYLDDSGVKLGEIEKGRELVLAMQDELSQRDFGKPFNALTARTAAHVRAQVEAMPLASQYDAFVLPGGTNYRELLITLRGDVAGYTGSHWQEKNVIAHIRFDDRVGADGEKVLFLHEIQSDWAQDGRQRGFASARVLQTTQQQEAVVAHYKKLQHEMPRIFGPEQDLHQMMRNMGTSEISKALLAAGLEDTSDRLHPNANAISDGPFVTRTESWVALAIKRMVKYAADNGYGRIAMISGQQSADRFELKDAGSDGIKAFYDEIVPQVANQVLRKLGGGRLGQVAIASEEFGDQYVLRKPDGQYVRDGQGIYPFISKRAALRKAAFLARGGDTGYLIEPYVRAGGNQPCIEIDDALRASVRAGIPMFSKLPPMLLAKSMPADYSPPDVQSADFAQWFGDSALRMDEGSPMRLFHATNADFSEFMPSVSGSYGAGIYLTPDANTASLYADGDDGHVIMPVYARMERPYRYDVSYDDLDGMSSFSLLYDVLPEDVADAIVAEDKHDVDHRITDALRDMGHDGVIVTFPDGSKEYLVFSPEQVKSSISNTGDFDSTNADIRFSRIPSAAKQIDLSFPADGQALRDIKIADTSITYVVNVMSGDTHISSIRTPQSKRRKGSARMALQEFLRVADKAQMRTSLHASALDSKTSTAKLVSFYRSLGFETTGHSINMIGDPEMIREPSVLDFRIDLQGPAFVRWFGDSRAVNEHGSPLVVYHGTAVDDDFATFKLSDRGIYFSSNPAAAEIYADGGRRGGGRLIPAYLTIKNPFFLIGNPENGSGPTSEYIGAVKAAGYDGVVIRWSRERTDYIVFDPEQIMSSIDHSVMAAPSNDSTLQNDFISGGAAYADGVAFVDSYDAVKNESISFKKNVSVQGPDDADSIFEETKKGINGLQRAHRRAPVKPISPVSSHELNAVRALAAAFDSQVIIFRQSEQSQLHFNGAKHGANIWLNEQAAQPLHTVFGHELLHQMKSDRPDLYASLYEGLEGLLHDDEAYAELAGLQRHDKAYVHEEMIADLLGARFAERDFWDQVSKRTAGAFSGIVSFVSGSIDKVRRALFGADSSLSGQADRFVRDLDQARNVLADVIADYLSDKRVGSGFLDEIERVAAWLPPASCGPQFDRPEVVALLLENIDAEVSQAYSKAVGGVPTYGAVFDWLDGPAFSDLDAAHVDQLLDVAKRRGAKVQHRIPAPQLLRFEEDSLTASRANVPGMGFETNIGM